MKVGSLIQHRRDDQQNDWGLGIIVDHCEAGTCKAGVSVGHHCVIHFPNRRDKEATAEFVHNRVSEGLDKDNLKWMVIA
jgi:hypothetical protein